MCSEIEHTGATSSREASDSGLDDIDHVAIQVDDIGAAVDWYCAHARCEVAYRDDTWALLRFANTKLALVVPDQHPPHLAITSPRAEAFGTLQPHRDGTASCYLNDPAGNVLEVLKA